MNSKPIIYHGIFFWIIWPKTVIKKVEKYEKINPKTSLALRGVCFSDLPVGAAWCTGCWAESCCTAGLGGSPPAQGR